MPVVRFLPGSKPFLCGAAQPEGAEATEPMRAATEGEAWEYLAAEREPLEESLKMFAHDARARLGAVQGYAEMLRDDVPGLSEEHKRYLRNILLACSQLEALIAQHREKLLGLSGAGDAENV